MAGTWNFKQSQTGTMTERDDVEIAITIVAETNHFFKSRKGRISREENVCSADAW